MCWSIVKRKIVVIIKNLMKNLMKKVMRIMNIIIFKQIKYHQIVIVVVEKAITLLVAMLQNILNVIISNNQRFKYSKV